MTIIQTLQETTNMIISVRTLDNTTFKGTVVEVDDYMNVILKNVDIITDKILYSPEVVIRGSNIKFFILPQIIKHL
ncbi:small nuclear ribonucleoprotein Sm D3 [Vairimorpha necatrix]|uniref:Small nuclear ribonucleoprotein Sm D3 n=1 Tax=Vairimorpha necatrix TaxID=6039 RepID=A0AAX4JFV0_9MICR